MKMIKKGRELLRRLKDLEKDRQEGRISESKYRMLKREYQRELEAIEVAERIKRMQGRSTSEKPLDHWIEKAKEEEETREKEELVKKYVKKPATVEKKPQAPFKVLGLILLALAFFIGSGFGLYLLNLSQDQTGNVLVNESAFPTFTTNNTSTTINYVPETTSHYNTTRYYEPTTPTTPTTPSEPATNTSG